VLETVLSHLKKSIHSEVQTFINKQKPETLEDVAWLAGGFSLSHKVTFAEKPKSPYAPPGQDPPPTAPRWPGNQRGCQNGESQPKENPCNDSANCYNTAWPRQNKMAYKATYLVFLYRKNRHLISNCLEKLRIARQHYNT